MIVQRTLTYFLFAVCMGGLWHKNVNAADAGRKDAGGKISDLSLKPPADKGTVVPIGKKLCYYDSIKGGKGVLLAWTKFPVPVYVNTSKLSSNKVSQPKREAAMAAVQAAFKAYEIACSKLRFAEIKETTSFDPISGGILVYWGNDSTTWNFAPDEQGRYPAYFHGKKNLYDNAPDIDYGSIGMNARDFAWTVNGAEAGKLDIQTAIMQMIGPNVGFYWGDDPFGGSFAEIKYNNVARELSPEQKLGILNAYFQEGSGCTKPTAPLDTDCDTVPPRPRPDAGPIVPKEAGVDPSSDGFISSDDGASGGGGDGSSTTTPPSSGCCRVAHDQGVGQTTEPLWMALGLIGLLFVLRRRGKTKVS